MTVLNKILVGILAVGAIFVISAAWTGPQGPHREGDLNYDGAVDLVDLSIMMSNMDATSTQETISAPEATPTTTSTSTSVGVSAIVE